MPVFRPPGWKAGTSQLDRVTNRLLLAIGASLVLIRSAHLKLYAEKWTTSQNDKASPLRKQ